MKPYVIKSGDTKEPLTLQLTDFNGAIDLTNCEVNFKMSTSYFDLLLNQSAEIVDPVDGQVKYQFNSAETSEAGYFYAAFEVTFPDFRKESFPKSGYLKVQINRSLRNEKEQD